MTLIKPLLGTTTALALLAGLAAPASAQSLSDTTPRELLDAARAGELDLGFDTTTLSRDELLAEIVRARALCDSGAAPEALACDRIAQLPDPSGWLAAPDASGGDNASEPAVAASEDEAPTLAERAEEIAGDTAPAVEPAEDDGVAALAQSLADDENPPAAADPEPPVTEDQPSGNDTVVESPAIDALAEELDAQAEEMPVDPPAAEPLVDAPPLTEPAPLTDDAPLADDAPATAQDAPANGDAETTAQADAENPDPDAPEREATSAEQADIAARIAEQGSASAAASAESTDGAELIEEELTDENTRSSSEDFDTRIGAAPAQDTAREKDDDDDDDDNSALRTFGAAALVGLGAVALNEMLGDNARVVENSGDRIVVEQDGQYRVLRNDDVLLRQPGSDVKTYRYDDGSTRTVVSRNDGASVETVKAADGRVLRRTRTLPNGETVVLFDDTRAETEVVINDLPQVENAPTRRINFQEVNEDELAAALAAQSATPAGRRFSLNQVRNIDAVRQLVPEISVDSINFATGSAAIRPEEARDLAALGNAMKRAIAQNPSEVFLIEGHTDATGSWGMNLALSDRRAESVALALTEYFQVPPENMVLQGYGEADLAIETQQSERRNRRAAVRRITELLQGS